MPNAMNKAFTPGLFHTAMRYDTETVSVQPYTAPVHDEMIELASLDRTVLISQRN